MPKKYIVEWFSYACTWEWMGEFAMKREAVAYIRSTFESEEEFRKHKDDFRIVVRIKF